MRSLGIDAAASYTGLSVVRSAPHMRDRLESVAAIHMGELDYWTRVEDRVVPWLWGHGVLPAGVDRVVCERAPDTAREDVDHGPQGLIGWVQGYVAGLCVAGARPGYPPKTPQPSEWRERLQILAARDGLLLELPSRTSVARAQSASGALLQRQRDRFRALKEARREPDRSGYTLTYRCCGGRFFVPGGLEVLVAANVEPCPTCSPKGDYGTSDADRVRDAWKAWACKIVGHFWPDDYARLVGDARSRARIMGQPDHHLNGVPDACEAVGIALFGLED